MKNIAQKPDKTIYNIQCISTMFSRRAVKLQRKALARERRCAHLKPRAWVKFKGIFCCTALQSAKWVKRNFLTFQLNCKNIQQINQQHKQTIKAKVECWKETLAETVEWRRTRPLHECHGGFEIPQTESALDG